MGGIWETADSAQRDGVSPQDSESSQLQETQELKEAIAEAQNDWKGLEDWYDENGHLFHEAAAHKSLEKDGRQPANRPAQQQQRAPLTGDQDPESAAARLEAE